MQDLCDLDLDLDLFKALVYIDCSSKNGETMVCTKMDVHVHALTIYFQDVLSTVLLSFVVTGPKESALLKYPPDMKVLLLCSTLVLIASLSVKAVPGY